MKNSFYSSLTKKDINALCHAAQTFFEEEKYKQAFNLFEEVCHYDHRNHRGLIGLASCCQKFKEFDRAIAYYDAASLLDGNNPYIYFNIYYCYLALKEYEHALGALTAVLMTSKQPRHARLNKMAEIAFRSIQNLIDPQSLVEDKILELPKILEEPKIILKEQDRVALFWKNEKLEGSEEVFLFHQRIDEQLSPFYCQRGLEKELLEELYALAYAKYEEKNYNKAVSLFLLMGNYNHLDKRVWMGLGASLEQLRKFKEAMKAYSAASRLDPKDYFPSACITICCCLLGKNEEASKALKNALKLANQDPRYDDFKGGILEKIKKLTDPSQKQLIGC